MLDRFFGVHPEVIRTGLWSKMKPGAKDLYVFLMEQSERHCTRELTRTDAQITAAVGVATRTLCDARKYLAEYGLIQFRRTAGNKFLYIICDPTARQPYPGDARQPITCRKRTARTRSEPPTPNHVVDTESNLPGRGTDEQPLSTYGLPGVFQ
jgi:hypothetical protein